MGSEWRPVYQNGGNTSTAERPNNSGYSSSSYRPTYEEEVDSSRTQPGTTDGNGARWYEPKATPSGQRVFVSAADVRQIIASAIGDKVAEDFRLFLGDNQYYLPPMTDAVEIINNSGLSRATYMPETFDCDDFAIVLKSHFCEAAYKERERRPPHCFGMIWGELPHVHAINWMINEDYRLRLIEPQNGNVFEPSREHRNITFMMA